MSPLSFGAEKMYHFISDRFDGTSVAVQEQCLEWLQVIKSNSLSVNTRSVFYLQNSSFVVFCCIVIFGVVSSNNSEA